LLPTIRSRCLAHTMAWPTVADALGWLHASDVKPADAPALLRAAGGRPEDALAFAQAGRDPKAWALLPRAIAKGDAAALADWTPGEAVIALQKLCHDLVAVRVGGAPRFFQPADLPATSSLAALTAWSRELASTARTVEHPFNAGLMLEALVSQARSALNSRG
jgi:DNA polymerase III subunit delta'